jgi:pSer/pThr/pTyr-binding forkhead associated (FHA) protein
MNLSLALAFQEPASDYSMWIILAVVLVILFFIVVIIGVGLTIFFIARRRSKAQKAAAGSALSMSSTPSSSAFPATSPEPPQVASGFESSSPPQIDIASPPEAPAERSAFSASMDFDPSRTVAIKREKTVEISYGTIKFTSGVLAGQQFDVNPEGSYIGRESSLSQIVVSDPRISKRHLWIGVRDGLVKIEDQDSRNGTFINDPTSDRVTQATLHSGDTVILGESDVARFEYHM